MASLNADVEKKNTPIARRLFCSTIAIAGYILSPLSWWNDLLVNIPLALALAGLLNRITGLDMGTLFIISYWATNIAGIIMMIVGGVGTVGGRVTRKTIVVSLLASALYTVIVVALLRNLAG